MNYYEILQVSPNAEAEVIQAAYRRLSMKYHPDRNCSSPEFVHKMKTLNAAYAVLSSPARRAEYDRTFSRSSSGDDPIAFNCPHCHEKVSHLTGKDGDICLCPACHNRVRLRKKRTHRTTQETSQETSKECESNAGQGGSDLPDIYSSFNNQALQELREKQSTIRNAGASVVYIGAPIIVALLILIMIYPAKSIPQYFFIVLSLLGFPAMFLTMYIVRRLTEERIEPVKVRYRLTNRRSDEFKRLVEAIMVLPQACVRRVKQSQRGFYERSSAWILFGLRPLRLLDCNIDLPCLAIGTDTHWFLPDCVLSFERGEYYASKLNRVSFAFEDITVYDGKEVIGHYWLHSRVDGGPDRRYRVNYQVPTYRDVFNTYCSLILSFRESTFRLVAEKASEGLMKSLASQYQRYCGLVTQSETGD